MVLKKENYIFTTVTTWGWTDETLMAAILGFLPDDKETHMIGGSEARILWSKTKLSNDIYYSAIDASVRLHKLCDELDFTVTNYGDIIIYRTINCNFTPQEVLDSYNRYNRYISSRFFIREENNKEDNKMTIEANKYIYIASNTINSSDDQLIAALLGYVPTCTEREKIHQYYPLWSRTKFLKERDFDVIDARRRLQEMDEKLRFATTYKGDVIIYRDVNNEVLRILDAYYEYRKKDDMEKFNCVKNNSGRYDPLRLTTDTQPVLTMPRNLGRTAAMSMLNSLYGLNPSFQAGLLRWGDWDSGFKLYFGVERATGKQKTVCIWKDGEKTIIRGDKSVLAMPVQCAVAWCYVKRRFKTTSQFKKYVDNHSHIMDGITYFEGDARGKMAQASTNNRTKKYDIYDAAALAITAKHYGSVKTIMAYCDGWGE